VLHGLGAVSFWQDPWAWLDETTGERDLARGFVNRIEAAVNSMTVIDWVLLAVAVALIAWVWASLRAITRLGPIEVAPLEHDGKENDAVPAKALTAQLREALSRTGLSPPPAVPTGTPQINLIDAIKESPIPQANWIASIVQLIPRPRPSEYHIGGVLLGPKPPADESENGSPGNGEPPGPMPLADESENGSPGDGEPPEYQPAAEEAEADPYGLRYAVVPAGDGTSKLDTVVKCASYDDAVTKAASQMFLHISQDATGAFPIWARWQHEPSLEAFVKCWDHRRAGNFQDAIDELENAKREEPFNALADLQVANLYEKCEPEELPAPGPGEPSEEVRRLRLRAHAVRRYLEVADAFHEVVEAHYRLAIAATTLASMVDDTPDPEAALIIGLDGVDAVALPGALREMANRESDTVLELLRPWWALKQFRLRTQFEPKGFERRVMRRAVRISRHCHGLRGLAELDPDNWLNKRRIWLEIRWRAMMVHRIHLLLGFGTAGWQAHYNAACFDALLLEHFT
jgi:hypothetical protein